MFNEEIRVLIENLGLSELEQFLILIYMIFVLVSLCIYKTKKRQESLNKK